MFWNNLLSTYFMQDNYYLSWIYKNFIIVLYNLVIETRTEITSGETKEKVFFSMALLPIIYS